MSAQPKVDVLSFGDMLASAGRFDMGAYRHHIHGAADEKFIDRQRVLNFILEHHVDTWRVKLLSFPGENWTFENMLLAAKPASQVIGLERSFSVFAQSRRAIPVPTECCSQSANDLQDRLMSYGLGEIFYSRVAALRKKDHGLKRSIRSHRLVLMDSATFCSVLATDYRATNEQRDEFYHRFAGRNAAWLDFTGSIGKNVLETLSHLHFVMAPADDTPVCITVRNGRDGMRGVEERIARLVEAQPLFKPAKHWTYIGAGGSSMLTVCGLLRGNLARIGGAQ